MGESARLFAGAITVAALIAGSAQPSSAGVREVKDINKGQARSKPRRMVEYRGQIYFDADDGIHGTELWRTDGTGRGTRLAVDILPGAESSSPIGPIIKVGDRLFFSAGASGDRSVFASDGTPAGTAPLPGTEGLNPFGFVPGGDRFLFRVPVEGGTELWVSDGTEIGTRRIRTISSNQSQDCPGLGAGTANSVAVVGAVAYFCSIDAEHGAELWRTDGTPTGTALVADLAAGTPSSSPAALTRLGDRVIFFARRSGVSELWSSDGTQAGTVELAAIPSNQLHGGMTVANGHLFFFSDAADAAVLWATDGTRRGTTAVDDLPFFTTGGNVAPGPGTAILFSAFRRSTGAELWRSDGTRAGTRLVKDIAPGHPRPGVARDSAPQELTPARGRTFFTARVPKRGRELWRTDGTRHGTKLVGEVRPGRGSANIHAITAVGKRAFFSAALPRHGEELWATGRR